MKPSLIIAAALAFFHVAPAGASVFGDELSKCIVTRTTVDDKAGLIRWMFAAMSANPKIEMMSKVSPEQRTALSLGAGKIIERLLTVDCRTEAVAALKADGPAAVGAAFELLGSVAMREFMSEPAVAAGMAAVSRGADEAKLKALFAEAGLPVK